MDTIFDLKKFRTEQLKVTQTQMAEALGIRQDTISRYEENPDEVPIKVVQSICSIYGVSFNQLLNFKKEMPKSLDVKDNWSPIRDLKYQIEDYINAASFNCSYEETIFKKFHNFESELLVKPKVVLLGRSDSGKSTMINAILGMERLPSSWTPVTSIIVYIKHIDDKPYYINDDLWVFKNDSKGGYWDDRRLNDKKYTESLKIASGDYSLLNDYGTGSGKQYNSLKDSVGSAVLFVDSPILKNCDFVDVPGFTGGKPSDVRAAQFAGTKADVLLYLSQSNSFMSIDDAVYLKGAINNLSVIERADMPYLPKLSNLFVLATQAHIIDNGDVEKINSILDSGSERFYNTLPEEFWKSRTQISGISSYNESDLRKRFFSYTTDMPTIRREFEREFREFIEQLPFILKGSMEERLNQYKVNIENDIDSKIKYQNSLLSKIDVLQLQLNNRMAANDKIINELNFWKNEMLSDIEKHKSKSWENFMQFYNSTINEEAIVNLLKSRGTQNKKSSKEEFLAYLSSKIDEGEKEAIMSESEDFSNRVEKYIAGCQEMFDGIDTLHQTDYKEECIAKYNVKRNFTAGISGLATFGALAIWASTLGNLGGYIIVSKMVGLLAAIGINLGGTAAVISTVSALGGPITWGIGIATVIGLTIFGLMGGGWKKQFAKSICAELDKNNAINDYRKANDKHWNDTAIAFEKGANDVVAMWFKQTDEIRSDIENYDKSRILKEKQNLEKAKYNFSAIPIK